MPFDSVESILNTCREQDKPFWAVILEDDIHERGTDREESFSRMKQLWHNMLQADETYDRNLKSASGIVGTDGGRMLDYLHFNDSLCGGFIGSVIAGALKMGESNACMKRIVAAPTAGACGVLPAVLIPCYHRFGCPESRILEALYTSAGIGQVIAYRASIAGASGGCQAEIGSASSMAAGALVQLRGGTPEQIADAAAMALKNLLGLVCDPVAGLVEVPCIKRNVIGAMGAVAAADMALAGIRSNIPADQVFDAMREIGDKMDASLRETGFGGLAATPEGIRLRDRLS